MNAITRQCLDAHNEYRRRHGAPPLVISDALMRKAQNWAQTNANRCSMYHSSNRGDVGENLYAGTARLTNGRVPVDSWYNEVKNYNWNRPGTGRGVIGHFTQVVWKGSTRLGVGWATGRNGWTYFCCNYGPAGNYTGNYRYNVFRPGTPYVKQSNQVRGALPGDEEGEDEAPAEEEEEEVELEEEVLPEYDEADVGEAPAEDDGEEVEEKEEVPPEEHEQESEEGEEEEESEGFSVGHVDVDEDYQWARKEDD